jgi:hypothetical protein
MEVCSKYQIYKVLIKLKKCVQPSLDQFLRVIFPFVVYIFLIRNNTTKFNNISFYTILYIFVLRVMFMISFNLPVGILVHLRAQEVQEQT